MELSKGGGGLEISDLCECVQSANITQACVTWQAPHIQQEAQEKETLYLCPVESDLSRKDARKREDNHRKIRTPHDTSEG